MDLTNLLQVVAVGLIAWNLSETVSLRTSSAVHKEKLKDHEHRLDKHADAIAKLTQETEFFD
jgi:hypothetical protein